LMVNKFEGDGTPHPRGNSDGYQNKALAEKAFVRW
jgi:hypothetical protein